MSVAAAALSEFDTRVLHLISALLVPSYGSKRLRVDTITFAPMCYGVPI